ncbi:hypothetical protein Vretimale_1000 [Volvox reticuliferus]|uniref:Cyclic nucleotide-binding domain-containing protein n=1 Tax=Volvox reticuliferus TaxID=1737510 RepID=A0A8J4D8Q4_9CHLO|nr:hypothetical protein Vretifemale_10478 [Volvox reticuliferus]GIL94836.1 hypothetical protein Vretimale_1000 [Volvox reticuliferus]
MNLQGQRSIELTAVPEYDSSSKAVGCGGDTPATTPQAGAGYPGQDAFQGNGVSGGASFGGGGAGIAANGGLRDNVASITPINTPRAARNNALSRGQMGALARASARLQQGGRQLMDLGRLQADLLSKMLVKRSEAQDYINEEDQGVVALLARHVVLPMGAWEHLWPDGRFWQNNGPGDFARNSSVAPHHDFTPPDESGTEGTPLTPMDAWEPRRSIFCLPVIQPYNLFAVLWTLGILLLDLTYTAFWVPINVAFCTSEYGKLSSGCTTSDLVGGVLYFLNTLLGFQVGVVATNGIRKRTVVDGRLVAWLYIRYGRFLLDFIASMPLVYLVVVLAGQSHFQLNKGWVNCLSLLRLLRMVRLVSITKVVYMDSLSGRFQDTWLARVFSVTGLYSMFLAYQLAVAINLFACIMVLCAYFEGYSNSWMTAVDWAKLPTASPIYQWFCAVYWMIVTATTTGFGDFAPRSVAEQVVANVAMVGGMIMFGVLVASIGQALSRATREAHQAYNARQKIIRVMEWAEQRRLPGHIQKQVQNFFVDKYGHKEEAAVDITMMAALPSSLRAKVALSICSPLVSAVHIFNELPEDAQMSLAENMRPIRLPAGEDLCQQGDVTNCLWILLEGTVQAARYKEEPVTLDAAKISRLLGESVLLGEKVEASRIRPWTLRTVTPCWLWGITLDELYPVMCSHPIIGLIAADYVKLKTVLTFKQARGHNNNPQDVTDDDGHWCEVAAVLVRQLQSLSPSEEADKLILELNQTTAERGTLQPFLEHLLELDATRRTANADREAARASSSLRRDMRIGQTETVPPPSVTREAHGEPAANVAGPSAACIAAAESPQHMLQQQQQQQQPHAAPAIGRSVFSTPAAAAALTAALMASSASQLNPGQQQPQPLNGPLPGPSGVSEQQQTSLTNGGNGPGAAVTAARPSPQPATVSPLTVIQCPGCQRCVCPSCGQGMDTAAPQAAAVATAAAGSTDGGGGAAAAAARPGAVGPGTRAWVSRMCTLRRVSIGVRADQPWASDRSSMDRRLGALSVSMNDSAAPVYL